MGYILYLSWATGTLPNKAFNTHNCTEVILTTNNTIAACITPPSYNSTLYSTGTGISFVIFGYLLSMGAYLIAYILAKPKKIWTPMLLKFPKEKVEFNSNLVAPVSFGGGNLGFAVISSLGDCLAHLIFFRYAGVTYNFYYWMVAGMFSNTYGQANVYAWPGFIVAAMIFIVTGIMMYLFVATVEARHKLIQEELRKVQTEGDEDVEDEDDVALSD